MELARIDGDKVAAKPVRNQAKPRPADRRAGHPELQRVDSARDRSEVKLVHKDPCVGVEPQLESTLRIDPKIRVWRRRAKRPRVRRHAERRVRISTDSSLGRLDVVSQAGQIEGPDHEAMTWPSHDSKRGEGAASA